MVGSACLLRLPSYYQLFLEKLKVLMPPFIFLAKWDFHPRRMTVRRGDANITALWFQKQGVRSE